MRVWFMVGALVLGIIGIWGEQGRGSRGESPLDRGGDGTVTAQDGSSTIPTPRPPALVGR
jgi:hypothetical protein